MRYLKKFNEADFWSAYRDPNDPEESRIKNHDILQDLNDISYEIKDDGYDFDIKEYYYQPKGQTFIICNILPGKYKSKRVSDAMIDTILRMVDYMYHNSYDLGSNNWVKKDSLRFMRNNEKPYNLTLEELKGLSDIDFTKIELVFAPII